MAPNDRPANIRLMRDISEFYRDKSKNIFIVAEDQDISVVHALIIGPEKTPYENGFFYFVLRYPTDYPLKPPNVKLITTGGQTVRFNPNFYRDGKVCLSILGTWNGPKWSPVLTLSSTLVSIQSLMSEKPYHNEPGYEETPHVKRNSNKLSSTEKKTLKAVKNYNEMITHETIRVAVLQMLDEKSVDSKNMPLVLKNIMISIFKSNYQYYEDLIRSKISEDGLAITDPFNDKRPKVFAYKQLLDNILKLKDRYFNASEESKLNSVGDDSSPPESSIGHTTIESDNDSGHQKKTSNGNVSDIQNVDQLVEPYNEMVAKVLSQNHSNLKESSQNPENWDEFMYSSDEDISEDIIDSYSEESEEKE